MSILQAVGKSVPAVTSTSSCAATLTTQSSLAQAFESFTHVAGALENSYTQLQAEVARLREELEHKNRDLMSSLAENESMRTYMANILTGLPCGVLVVDSKLSLQFANPEGRRLLAVGAEDAGPSGTSIPDSLRSVLNEAVLHQLGSERTWTLDAADGPRSIGVTCALFTSDSAPRDELVFILRDMTEEKRLQRERERSRRLQALAQMTALLAHEIRNPLGSLELFAGLIGKATHDQKEVSEWVVHLQAGLRALSATVNNVLQFHTQALPQPVPVNLTRILADTVEFLRPLVFQRAMGIVFLKPPQPLWLRADPDRLQQVFFNLAINAFRAMPSGGSLIVRANPDGQDNRRVLIEFEDEGVGIAPENLDKIFEAGFKTSSASLTRHVPISGTVRQGVLSYRTERPYGST